MSFTETNDYHLISASNKTSRIPRFVGNNFNNNCLNYTNVNRFINDYNCQTIFKRLVNLNNKGSKIPIYKWRHSLDYKSQKLQQIDSSVVNKLFDCNLFVNSIDKIISNDINVSIIATNKSSIYGLTQPLNYLKVLIKVIKSDISIDNKFKAIKQLRDQRLSIIGDQLMAAFNDEKVREWVDSGYISNNTSIAQTHDDVFGPNEPQTDTITASTSHSTLHSRLRDAANRRRHQNMRTRDLIAMNSKYSSFNSDFSMSSISSIESLLESRREDPEELLLALGFGYIPEDQTANRIPKRFLESPSYAKGVNSDSIMSTYGLQDIPPSHSSPISFPTTADYRERSYSSGRIGERLRKRMNSRESLMKTDLPEIITSSCHSLLQSSSQTESILNPANRKFLESQGKEDEPNKLTTKRLIIGTKSYKLDIDGDPLAFPKTPSPSPQATTPVPSDDNSMEVVPQSDEQNIIYNNDNYNQQQFVKRKQIQRQNCILDQSIGDQLSSDLSSSTNTLIGTVFSGNNEVMASDPNDYHLEMIDKRNAFSQTNSDFVVQNDGNKAVEAALVVAIQSIRLSLEFYRHQSLRLAKISNYKYNETTDFNEDDLLIVQKIHELRERIHKEIVEMDVLLNRHIQLIHTYDVVDMSFIPQAHVFIETVNKVKQLLNEQQNLYLKIGFTKFNDNC
ncbi:protein ITPRID2-like [Oppia nitens]|uniref:protein ITPRID2-like n=1 Tax=Oppia nitens TaxID=1686743 RepID=UPI0023DAC60A|nr:protein ITPRID2-like [Oppia nitens]